MEIIAALLLAGHYVLLLLLCIFGMHRIYTTYSARARYRQPEPEQVFDTLPLVTIQLPLFNERHVAERLIDAAAALDYPRDRLQIQVLDDSTDHTRDIVAARVAQHHARGVWIEHVHRTDRVGYKAGALADALDSAVGEFIAVFDADFTPEPGLIKRMIHHFSDPTVGVVQSQWDYLNREDSLLTRVQGLMLDAHFAIEQTARYARDVFFNFNGTAGIWRRQAIDDAGGWQADTITEDLDLSYRAQLADWRFVYLRDERCMSELPGDMNAFKSQQRRWAKGSIEVMRKLLPTIWRAPLSTARKVESTLHLTSNLSHLIILIDAIVFLIPAVMLRQTIIPYPPLWIDLLFFAFGGLSHVYFYLGAQAALGRRIRDYVALVPVLMATSIGLARSNGYGVLEALLGQRSGFVRTPKAGSSGRSSYLVNPAGRGELLETVLGVIYALVAIWCWQQNVYLAMPFMILFAYGYLFTGTATVREAWRRRYIDLLPQTQ